MACWCRWSFSVSETRCRRSLSLASIGCLSRSSDTTFCWTDAVGVASGFWTSWIGHEVLLHLGELHLTMSVGLSCALTADVAVLAL